MTTEWFHLLICDDDASFARGQAADLRKKLATVLGEGAGLCRIETLSKLAILRRLSQNPREASQWDMVCCDLGWGDLTLEGIQVLHDFQLSHPSVFTVLYTAQSENESVGQALEWKLHFVDRVLRVSDRNFFEQLLSLVLEHLQQKRSTPATLGREKSKLKPDQLRQQRMTELMTNLQRFPRLEAHDLLALAKPAYIRFVQEKFGGFPQLAKTTGLDLNNIYRVNRRFKNSPFVVFKYDTIQILFGLFDVQEREKEIARLLCPEDVLRHAAGRMQVS